MSEEQTTPNETPPASEVPADETPTEQASAEETHAEEARTDETTADGLVRVQEFEAGGPLELDVAVTIGRVELVLDRESGARVELRHDQGEQQPWVEGVNNLLSWVGERFGDQLGVDPTASPPKRSSRAGSRSWGTAWSSRRRRPGSCATSRCR